MNDYIKNRKSQNPQNNSQINRPSSLYARYTLMWKFLQNSRPVSKITAKKIPTPPAIEGLADI